MTYRELLRILLTMQRFTPDHLDDYVAVCVDPPTPLFVTHTEYNDGSVTDGVEPYQLLLMTV